MFGRRKRQVDPDVKRIVITCIVLAVLFSIANAGSIEHISGFFYDVLNCPSTLSVVLGIVLMPIVGLIVLWLSWYVFSIPSLIILSIGRLIMNGIEGKNEKSEGQLERCFLEISAGITVAFWIIYRFCTTWIW